MGRPSLKSLIEKADFGGAFAIPATEKAMAIFIQAIHRVWEEREQENSAIKLLKPACIAFFEADNGPTADPYALVCAYEPPRFVMGYQALKHELVPAWTLYLNRATVMLSVLKEKGLCP